ncbi:MAG: VacJ family lipoprotein [Thiotrichaceae bacterium]|nr:VacJ family lipoprotein [Thiotrichaceae bacterium]
MIILTSRFRLLPFLILTGIILLTTGCASTTPDGDVNDPFEPVNRNIYEFNEGFDRIILKPVAKGYQKLPDPVQTGTHNFFSNLDDVVVVVNDILQLNPEQFTSNALRLSVNTVFGLLGLIDMGTPMGLPKHHESFADTLGYWGVGSGPFIVLPILGPSSVRDAPSLIVDFLVHPLNLVSPASATIALASVRAVDIRSELLKTTDIRDKLALDPYVFTRESYYQWRQNRIYNGEPPKVIIEDFEDFEDF